MNTLQMFWQQIVQLVGGYVPNLIGALAILLLGWLVALAISAIVRTALRRTKLDERVASWIAGEKKEGKPVEAGEWIAKGVFYLVMLFVLIAFFQVLGLTIITEPLNSLLVQVFQYAPRLLGAGALLLLAWLAATLLRFLVTRALRALKIDQRLGDEAGIDKENRVSLSETLGNAIYWLIFLFFLPAVLSTLALQGLLAPVQGMLDKALGFLPNIFAAGLILVVGWFVARIVQRIVSNLLVAIGLDRLSDRVGLSKALGKQKLSGVLGLILYVLILLPVIVAALNALALDAITQPATSMLDDILTAFPAIFAAALLLGIAYVVARMVSGLVANVLAGVGFDAILAKLGLRKESQERGERPSQVVGYLVLVGIMLFASIEALRLLGFGSVAELVTSFTAFAGQVVLGLIVFGIGLYLANLAAKTIKASGAAQSSMLALAARVSILALAGAMALREMGLANEIINLAFGLVLGAVAVAVALAFGLGGREVASRELETWVESVKSREA